MTIETLPDNILLDHIVVHLSIAERCRLFGMNRRLFFSVKDDHERSLGKLTIEDGDEDILPEAWKSFNIGMWMHWPQRMIDVNLNFSLHTLELNSHGTDDFLEYTTTRNLFPLLRTLSMIGSDEGLTNRGLESLSRHPSAKLETIDLTFCLNTTYDGTFCLRDRFRDSLKCLRRQPAWLDGHFHTPFGNHREGEAPEIHTYYPDGTFSFSRSIQSRGFVIELIDWNWDDETYEIQCLADKLQYSNFVPQPGWPSFTEFSYRPGVCLFPLPDEKDKDGIIVRSILVGQNLNCLRPSCKIKNVVEDTLEFLLDMDIGESCYFAEQDAYAVRGVADEETSIMISRMRVYPLESELPPDDLVEECKRTCKAIQNLGAHVIDRFEEDLHEFFEGRLE